MIKQFSLPKAWFLTFYSREFYKDLANNWRGVGYGALFLLLLICWIPVSIRFHQEVKRFITHETPDIIAQIPAITIKDGIVSTPLNKPYFIFGNQNKEVPLAIIDTSGQYNNLVDTKAQLLLTQNKLMIRNEDGTIKDINIEKSVNVVITQTEIKGFLQRVQSYGVYFYYGFGLVMSYIYRIIQGLFYAAIGYFIIKRVQRSALSFKTILRLTMFAITPAIVIGTIFELLSVHYHFEVISFFALSMAYLIFAMHVNRVEKVEEQGIV